MVYIRNGPYGVYKEWTLWYIQGMDPMVYIRNGPYGIYKEWTLWCI